MKLSGFSWPSIAIAVLLFMLPESVTAQEAHGYVLAPSGLNLRSTEDPKSAKIMTVPYGGRVTTGADAPEEDILTVDNLTGGMHHAEYEGKSGYLFEGYICRYPAPKKDEEVEKYMERVRKDGHDVYFETHRYDYDGYYRFEEGITLVESNWVDAFLVARMLGEIPLGLLFPGETGTPGEKSVINPDKKDYAWSDQMDITWGKSGLLEKISYFYRGEGGGNSVTISRAENDNGLHIMMGSIAD